MGILEDYYKDLLEKEDLEEYDPDMDIEEREEEEW